MTALIVIVALVCALLIGYIGYYISKWIKAKPKVVKESKPKESGKLKINDFKEEEPERPLVLEETQPEEAEKVEDIPTLPPDYVPSWDKPENQPDPEEDDLEEFRHFPALSHQVQAGESLSEQIKNLPEEIKILMMSNIFDKKE